MIMHCTRSTQLCMLYTRTSFCYGRMRVVSGFTRATSFVLIGNMLPKVNWSRMFRPCGVKDKTDVRSIALHEHHHSSIRIRAAQATLSAYSNLFSVHVAVKKHCPFDCFWLLKKSLENIACFTIPALLSSISLFYSLPGTTTTWPPRPLSTRATVPNPLAAAG